MLRRIADAVFYLMQTFIQVFRSVDRFEKMHRVSGARFNKSGD